MKRDREKQAAYQKKSFSALNPRGHYVNSKVEKEGSQFHKGFEVQQSPYGVMREADSLIAQAAEDIITRELFWGDVLHKKEKVYLYYKGTRTAEQHAISSRRYRFRLKQRKEYVMSLHSLIANGGRIVIVGGRMNDSWARFANDPRFVFWTGDKAEVERNLAKNGGDSMPSNTHGVILSRFLGHSTIGPIMEEARRRRITIMGLKNDGEVTRILEEIVTPPPIPTKPSLVPPPRPEPPKLLRPPVKGELLDFAKKYDDATKTIRESGAVIFQKMKEAGIQTTTSSVEQSIGNMRRAAGVFANPKLSKGWKAQKQAPTNEPAAPTPPPPVVASPAATAPQQPPTTATPPPVPVTVNYKAGTPVPELAAKTPSRMEDETTVLLKMIEDVKASLDLVHEAVKRMHAQTTQYRELEAKLAELGFIRK